MAPRPFPAVTRVTGYPQCTPHTAPTAQGHAVGARAPAPDRGRVPPRTRGRAARRRRRAARSDPQPGAGIFGRRVGGVVREKARKLGGGGGGRRRGLFAHRVEGARRSAAEAGAHQPHCLQSGGAGDGPCGATAVVRLPAGVQEVGGVPVPAGRREETTSTLTNYPRGEASETKTKHPTSSCLYGNGYHPRFDAP